MEVIERTLDRGLLSLNFLGLEDQARDVGAYLLHDWLLFVLTLLDSVFEAVDLLLKGVCSHLDQLDNVSLDLRVGSKSIGRVVQLAASRLLLSQHLFKLLAQESVLIAQVYNLVCGGVVALRNSFCKFLDCLVKGCL